MRSYAQAVTELEALGIMPDRMPDLGPTRRALERAGLLERINARRNIVIAGTNGKGSTAATLSRLMHEQRQRVGLFTSPHLISTCERIRLAEEDVSEELFVRTYQEIRPLIPAERLTHFEALTLIAAHLFYSGRFVAPVDWGIWEVGLGGLHDSTNAIPHHYCAITRLGLDHQAILGATLPEIAVQKMGIVQTGCEVVHSALASELDAIQQSTATRTESRWTQARPVQALGRGNLKTPWGQATSPLLGARAAENTAVALTLFETLGFEVGPALESLARVRWPGRFSPWEGAGFSCPAFLSGDHNPQGIESLLDILKEHHWERLHLILGFSKDKEVEAMLSRLADLPRARMHFTETNFKSLALENIPGRFIAPDSVMERHPAELLRKLRPQVRADDLVVATGSLYLIGRILGSARSH